MSARARLACALLLAPAAAIATEPAPALARYLPKYPAIYYTVGYLQDDRDSSFDAHGTDRASAVPTLPGHSAYPEWRAEAAFTSYFPLFEDADLPYFSSRIHSAKLTLRYGSTQAEGAMANYLATNPEFAPRSEGTDSGIGDVSFEFGSFIFGGQDWRTRKDTPFALVALVGVDIPNGSYEQTAPQTQGSNRYAWGPKLGVHWRPWSGGFVEAGAGLRRYGRNRNANFGRLAPAWQGDDRLLDLSLAQRLFRGAYLQGSITDRVGDANRYHNPRYAPNAPAPNAAPPGGTTESFPIPGDYTDGGTALRTAALSFNYFITQRLMATLDYAAPLSGESGQPGVRFRQRQCQAGSAPGSGGCTESDFPEPVTVDGQGTARAFSSDSVRLSVSYDFGHADPFACTGCER